MQDASETCSRCGTHLLRGEELKLCSGCQLDSIGLDFAALAPASVEPLPTLEGCDVIERVAAGGMGTVYKAQRTEAPRQTVAIKVMNFAGLSRPEAARRFSDEIDALADISHPNVARIIEAGVTFEGSSYYMMEWVDGQTLQEYLKGEGAALGFGERLALAEKICDSVAACHRKAVVHRDLNPKNIMVDLDGEPKLLDFGIAKLLHRPADAPETVAGAVIGYPGYVSPEQAGEKPAGLSADVFVLGIHLCVLFGMPHPFPTDSDAMVDHMNAVLRSEPKLQPRPGTPSDLLAVIRKALEKNPSDRYTTADGLVRICGTSLLATR